jgi:hypothetical protein
VLVFFVAGAAGAGGADPTFAPGPLVQQVLGIADFNSDGTPDLAVVDASNEVGVLLGNGAGAFRAARGAVNVKAPAYDGAAADFNGDGRADLAVATSQTISVLLGDGAGDSASLPAPRWRPPASSSPLRI